MKKQAKKVMRVKFLSVVLKANKLIIQLAKTLSDNSVKSEIYTLSTAIVSRLQKATSQKEFASIINNSFLQDARLDTQAKKQQLTQNTHYCNSRNYIALALNRLQYAEVAFRQRHEAVKTLKKLKTAKKTKKHAVKKHAVKK